MCGSLVKLAKFHYDFRVRKFFSNFDTRTVIYIGDGFFEHGRPHERVSGGTHRGEGMAVEANPTKAKVLECSQDIFFISKAWPRL